MRRWHLFLLLGLVIGLGVGFSLGLMAHSFGWLAPSQTPLSERPPRTGTAFVEKFSLATAAKEALPGVPWNELWDHKRETSIFGADGKSSRNGAIVRYCVIRNAGNHPISPKEQTDLHQRLFETMVAALQAEGAEVFDASAAWSNNTETVLRLLPADPDPKAALAKPNVRTFLGGQICYRTKSVEGRVFSSVSGEGGPAATFSVVIVEQPTESRLFRID